MDFSEILLFLFTIFIGIAFGAGLYEARIVIPLWFNKTNAKYSVNHENLNSIDSGRKFWGFITTGPLTLLTLINLIFAFQSSGEIHNWWLIASITILIERTLTFSFFIPTIIKLQRDTSVNERNNSIRISRWIRINYLRNALTLAAWLATLKAITLF
jgi:hypothetical protein